MASIFVGAIVLSLRLTLNGPIAAAKASRSRGTQLPAGGRYFFRNGRLTKLTHPMWVYFETSHDLSHCTDPRCPRVSDGVLTFLQEEFGHYLVVVRHGPQRFTLSTIEYE